jgi:iron complex outermembrane receptor protein
MAGINYRFNDDLVAYFTYTEGFTAGGWNGRGGTVTTLGPFEPEKGDNLELGIKSDWMDGRLRINATAFSTNVEDFQTAFIRPAPGGGGQETIQSNLGEFETGGFELEVMFQATDNLTLWANYSQLDTERAGFCTDPDGPTAQTQRPHQLREDRIQLTRQCVLRQYESTMLLVISLAGR